MSSRIATSIVTLAALMAATISPVAACALICEGHSRVDAHHHCRQDSVRMQGMVHDHSAMHHSAVGDMTLVVQAHSCQTDCAVVELNISRNVVPQVTVVQTGAVVLGAVSKFLAPHLESSWSLDSGPPFLPSAYIASYSILRI